MDDVIDRSGIERTYEVIAPHVRHTPVLDLDGVTLKLEQLQHGGSFKARGAIANLLLRDVPSAGVAPTIASSAANSVNGVAGRGVRKSGTHRRGATSASSISTSPRRQAAADARRHGR